LCADTGVHTVYCRNTGVHAVGRDSLPAVCILSLCRCTRSVPIQVYTRCTVTIQIFCLLCVYCRCTGVHLYRCTPVQRQYTHSRQKICIVTVHRVYTCIGTLRVHLHNDNIHTAGSESRPTACTPVLRQYTVCTPVSAHNVYTCITTIYTRDHVRLHVHLHRYTTCTPA